MEEITVAIKSIKSGKSLAQNFVNYFVTNLTPTPPTPPHPRSVPLMNVTMLSPFLNYPCHPQA